MIWYQIHASWCQTDVCYDAPLLGWYFLCGAQRTYQERSQGTRWVAELVAGQVAGAEYGLTGPDNLPKPTMAALATCMIDASNLQPSFNFATFSYSKHSAFKRQVGHVQAKHQKELTPSSSRQMNRTMQT